MYKRTGLAISSLHVGGRNCPLAAGNTLINCSNGLNYKQSKKSYSQFNDKTTQAYYYKTILYYTILYYTILYYTMLCYAMLCYAMLCYAMLCYAMLCYAMLCYAILYYTILYYSSIK